ncbi:chitin disaccharide deacetylase [soil metagenome]
MSGSRILIVNADDFGRSPGINTGIIEAHLRGIVTSTTLMVNLPCTGSAVKAAGTVPDLSIGLHLNFCYGHPVSRPGKITSLVDEGGRFILNTDQLISRGEIDHIAREAERQLRRFLDLMGSMPSHLDSHKYLHSVEPFRSVVVSMAATHRLPARASSEDDRIVLLAAGVPTTDRFEGRFHGLDGVGIEQRVLDQALDELQPGTTELMCHPGIVDQHIRDSSYAADRERELQVLCSGETADRINQLGVMLATFRDLSV